MTVIASEFLSLEPLPVVTVAMPVYNAGRFLRPAVLSIVQQSYRSWELLIMDDGSTDDALDSISDINDVRIRIYRDGCNRGIAVRLNEAIDLARGRYFARMDADDVSYPQRLLRQVTALQSDSQLDLLATRAISIDEDNQLLGVFPYALSHSEICRQPWRGFFFPHPTWMGKIEWFRKFKYKVPAPYCSEDQELLLRSYRESRYATLPEILFAYRIRSKILFTKLFKTRRSIAVFQQGIFLKNCQWLYCMLSGAAFVVKVIVDLYKRIMFHTFSPNWGAASESVVSEWRVVRGGDSCENNSL